MKRYHITTFGCQMNVHDSEKIEGVLQAEGCSPTDDSALADIIVFNTCSIRHKAEQKFLSQLGRVSALKKDRRDIVIAVAGCVAEQEGAQLLKKSFRVDYVVGPQNIHVFKQIARGTASPVHIGDNPFVADIQPPVSRGRTVTAWVTIMHGCNNFCSYCVVPYTRGREKSRDSQNVVREIKDLALRGIKEVTLLGQNVNSYNNGLTFPDLLRQANDVEGIERIRFITSHPKDLSDDLIMAIRNLPKVCEHIHLPLQSGSTKILNLMNRKYTYDEYRAKVRKLKDLVPNISITSDIITGFPQESHDDFLATMEALKEIRFDGIFAFAFSPRRNTKAATMEGIVPEAVRYERLARILVLQDEITDEKNALFRGTEQEILIEGAEEDSEGQLMGRTRGNKKVLLPSDTDTKQGDLINVIITTTKRHSFKGLPK